METCQPGYQVCPNTARPVHDSEALTRMLRPLRERIVAGSAPWHVSIFGPAPLTKAVLRRSATGFDSMWWTSSDVFAAITLCTTKARGAASGLTKTFTPRGESNTGLVSGRMG